MRVDDAGVRRVVVRDELPPGACTLSVGPFPAAHVSTIEQAVYQRTVACPRCRHCFPDPNQPEGCYLTCVRCGCQWA